MAGRYTLTQSAYAVLGVTKYAGDDEIRKAYRRRARETHPDVGGSATEFAEVQQAWELIGTEEARARYDREQLYASAAAGATTHTGYATSSGPNTMTVDFETFIRAAAAAAQQQRAAGARRQSYWAEFGPAPSWTFARPAEQQQPEIRPVSWLALASPLLAFFFPIGGVIAGAVGMVQTRGNRKVGRNWARWGLIASSVTTLIYSLPTVINMIG